MKIAFVADLAATLLAMVRSGDGVAWLPQTLAAHDVASKTIVAAADQESNLWVPIEIRLYRPAKKCHQMLKNYGSYLLRNKYK